MYRGDERRKAIARFIEAYTWERGESPTLREIGAAVGLASISSVGYHLRALERDGIITSRPGANRSWRPAR